MYCYYNGNIVEENNLCINTNNRSFKYGDGIFETLRIFNHKILFVEKHYQRLLMSMKLLAYNTHDMLKIADIIQIGTVLSKQNNILNGRMRIHISRKGAGLYSPESNEFDFLIEVSPLNQTELYYLSDSGLNTGLYSENSHQKNLIPGKTASSLFYIMAALYRKKNQWDDILLINNNKEIVEGGSSNFYAIIKNTIITPPLSSGCIHGIYRELIFDFIAQQDKWQIIESAIHSSDLKTFDGIFLTNVISGIRWIAQCEKYYYQKKAVISFYSDLNAYLLKKIN